MTGDELKAIRFKLGLSGLEWGRVLGYAARDPRTLRNVIRRFERGERLIPSSIALLAWMYGEHGLPPRKSTPIGE